MHQHAPCIAVHAKLQLRIVQLVFQHHRGAVIQRMRQRRLTMHPLQPQVLQRQLFEKRRPYGHGMHRAAEIVPETGQRQLHGPRRTAGLRLGLEHLGMVPGPRQYDRSRQPIWARPDDIGPLHLFILSLLISAENLFRTACKYPDCHAATVELMRIAFLDCFAGAAGDMFLGALIDAGVPAEVLHTATAALDLGATLKLETVNRSGISCTKVHVYAGDTLAEAAAPAPAATHSHTHDHPHQHPHKPHAHGRSLSTIRRLIQDAALADAVKQTSIHAFELLGAAEAKIHNVPLEKIHFHEVGAIDAIVDIVAASAGIHHLQIDQWFCSPLNVGSGTVVCAHGTFPVPAPATADLLRGLPIYSAHVQKELVTPTGAALIRALAPDFGTRPVATIARIGYGAGTYDTPGFPNVLSLSIGETSSAALPAIPSATASSPADRNPLSLHDDSQSVTVLETALDDLSPQIIAHVAEQALALGALDAMLTPVIMKKGRPGTLLTILCNQADSAALQQLILRETSTIGLRIRQDRRVCLDRAHQSVQTPYGNIRMKVATLDGAELNAAPEFEDCRAAALQHDVPLKLVQQAAIAAFRSK